jgi:PAS domain S-box-containing protein
MKEILSSISNKTKYTLILLATLFFVLAIIYVVYIYPNPIINSDNVLRALIFSEIIVILYMIISICRGVKSDSILKSVSDMMKDEISDGTSIFNTISDGIIVIDKKGKVRNINQGLCRTLGFEGKQLVNKNLYNLLNGFDNSDENKSLILTLIESLEAQKELRQKEKLFFIDTEVRYLALSTYMLKNKNMSVIGVLAVVHDFTNKKKLEQQLQHVEKLATASQMAAELAHEIKNPICSIKGLIQIMGKKYCLEDTKYYEVITNEIDRINALIYGFLTLTQKKPIFEKVSINSVMEDLLPLVESYAEGKNISINIDIQKEVPFINADIENIRQVIINIIQNGVDALHKNGGMNICVWYDQLNELVKMEFKDNGSGIKPEYLDKIFEPYFTTKSNGTGLGLAISHKIIENHYGRLFAFNNLDGGATFIVELPVCNN